MEGITQPVVDMQVLQAKANEAALNAALKEIEEFYNGYKSPYREAIKEYLKNKSIDHAFSVPDIVVAINEELTEEVDRIANTAIAKSFLPLAKKILTRAEPEIVFSNILKKYIEIFYDKDDHDIDDFSVQKTRDEGSFMTYTIESPEKVYDINIFKKSEGTLEIYTLPWKTGRDGSRDKQTMKLTVDGCTTLEMPFTKNILNDEFLSFIATLIMANSNIIFDTTSFDEDMFPNNHCHCD